jgi:hypothetical protein
MDKKLKAETSKSPHRVKNGSSYKSAKHESKLDLDSDPSTSTFNSRNQKKVKRSNSSRLDVEATFNGKESDDDSGEGPVSKHEKTPKEMNAICKASFDLAFKGVQECEVPRIYHSYIILPHLENARVRGGQKH